MTAFAITIFVLMLLRSIVCLHHLASATYPRQDTPSTVGADSARLILSLALMAWAAFVAWGS